MKPLIAESKPDALVYTTKEAAAYLKVSQKTVYRLVDRGLLKAWKGLRHLRITRESLEHVLHEP